MTRTVEINLDLLKQIEEQEGCVVYLRIYDDGSGTVVKSDSDNPVRGTHFSPGESPNETMRKAIRPKPPTLLEDLETVRLSTMNSKVEAAYHRLVKHLSRLVRV